MATAALVARVDLAAAFALSAGTKLADLGATTAALAAFGVPAPAATARILPGVEAGLAFVLLAFPASLAPGLAAFVTVAIFTAVVARRLAQGVAVPCPCFAAREGRPVSAVTLVRNLVLLALATLAAVPARDASAGVAIAVLVVAVPLTAVALRRTA
ncbi:MAG: MauE/DoxX family redox-associated membrane protein [Acidimicrobiia bacterium]